MSKSQTADVKVTIVTIAYNAASTIEETIKSVLAQDYKNREYVLIDGGSTDGTLDIIDRYRDQIDRIISEPDNGIYDAMNKGIAAATGDVIGFLNSDDVYRMETAVSHIAETFADTGVDTVFSDIVIVDWDNPMHIHRYLKPNRFRPSYMRWGWMPPHPTFYARKACFEKAGNFRTDFKIAADWELVLRFLKVHGFSYRYIPEILVQMRRGGLSTQNLSSTFTINEEIARACKMHGVYTNRLMLWSKYFRRVFELVARPR